MSVRRPARAPRTRRVLISTSQEARDRQVRRIDALTGRNYGDALVAVGLLPLMIASLEERWAESALDAVDALLLSGGVDVDPRFFGHAPEAGLGEVDLERDRFELALYRAARRRGMPILGICRGIQLAVVAEGGTLLQDLAAVEGTIQHEQRSREGDPIHRIRIEPGSALAAAFGTDAVHVNSYHHQAAGRLPDTLRTVATTEDGIVEAVEGRDGAFLLAVQWHPELSFRRHPDQLAPFRALADALAALDTGTATDSGTATEAAGAVDRP